MMLTTLNSFTKSPKYLDIINSTIKIPKLLTTQNTLHTFSPRGKIKKKKKLNLKSIEAFINPKIKSLCEIKKLRKIKEKLSIQKFNNFHRYKLFINPNNYYHNYGLDKLLIINNNRNKTENKYQYNNISSYNNVFFQKEESKIINDLNLRNDNIWTKFQLYRNIGDKNNKIDKIDKAKTMFNKVNNNIIHDLKKYNLNAIIPRKHHYYV